MGSATGYVNTSNRTEEAWETIDPLATVGSGPVVPDTIPGLLSGVGEGIGRGIGQGIGQGVAVAAVGTAATVVAYKAGVFGALAKVLAQGARALAKVWG
jgi:hypothetical protein